MQPPAVGVVPLTHMVGDDDQDTALLRDMASDAERYLQSFRWCKGIEEAYWGGGVGKVFALFLFKIIPATAEIDEWLWVVTGDVPQAYLVLDESNSPAEAFETYLDLMTKWVDLAREGRSSPDLPPTGVPPTPESATDLAQRLNFLKTEIKPFLGRGL